MTDKNNSETSSADDQATVVVNDIGGVDHAEVELKPGITTLSGANATNRSSILQALNEALGGTLGSVRRGADGDEGHVELIINNDVYTRTLKQHKDSISRGGDPYTDNVTAVNLYASLLEHNEIRQLIETGDITTIDAKLADLLMAPLDVESIQAKIEQHQQRKQEIEDRLEEIEAAKEELPELEEQRQTKQAEVTDLKDEIAAKREQIADLDLDWDAAEQAQEQLDALQAAQEELRDIEVTIEQKERTVEESKQRLADIREKRDSVETSIEEMSVPEEDAIDTLAERREQLEHVASLFGNLVKTNRMLLNVDRGINLPDEFRVDEEEEDVTAALVPGSQSMICPICGNTVERDTINDRLSDIQSRVTEYHNEVEDIEERQEELRSQRQKLKELHQERESLENDIRRIEFRIEEDIQRIEELEDERDEKQAEVDNLRKQAEQIRERRNRELETLYDEIAELQSKRADAKTDIDRLEVQIGEHESVISEEETLRDKKDELERRIEEQRSRVNRVEKRIQDATSTHMEALVERLEYHRIEGIRIDRKPADNPAELSEFELVVARRREDGVIIMENDLSTLSESERSLVALVVALAGYVAHEITTDVPFLLLDSIEQFDADRLDRFLEYVREQVDVQYIVTALLPEDAKAIATEHIEIKAKEFA